MYFFKLSFTKNQNFRLELIKIHFKINSIFKFFNTRLKPILAKECHASHLNKLIKKIIIFFIDYQAGMPLVTIHPRNFNFPNHIKQQEFMHFY